MEKPHTNFSVSRVLSSFKSIASGSMSPDMLWRIIVGSLFCVTLGICIFAYLTYMWALNSEVPQGAVKPHDTSSLADIEKVITAYQAKEATYNDLLHTRPEAPPYIKGKGIVVSSPDDTEVNNVASGTPPIGAGIKIP